MPIQAIENNTEVMTPTGHIGRVRVTRRERKLIAAGKKHGINVLGTDGLTREYDINQITEVDRDNFEYHQCAWWDEA